ncbi:MAG TPA: FAD-binding protein, partial [Anaerolineae bacterium]|nr:FAD-binding protein [Anaerolineae bacterium]
MLLASYEQISPSTNNPMTPPQHDCIIIGAGLSGLLTAVRLQQAGIKSLILEARERVGGRILTIRTTEGDFDLGPAWWWAHHTNVQRLMRELAVQGFEQFEQGIAVYDSAENQPPQYFRPQPMSPSYRFVGGVAVLIDKLVAQLPPQTIRLNTIVHKLVQDKAFIRVETNDTPVFAQHVVCTLPPKLIADSLTFEPPLPTDVVNAMRETTTWMGQAMKVTLAYKSAFWRARGLSGLTMSHVGPVAQFHDHGSADHKTAALFGWIGDQHECRGWHSAERRSAIIQQAVRLFGTKAAHPTHYAECNWADQPF